MVQITKEMSQIYQDAWQLGFNAGLNLHSGGLLTKTARRTGAKRGPRKTPAALEGQAAGTQTTKRVRGKAAQSQQSQT